MGKIKVLVIGNSFSRDWANVLLESKHSDDLDLSYIESPVGHPQISGRSQLADIIFVTDAFRSDLIALGLDDEKVWSVGTKNFGKNSGYFYNNRGDSYCTQRCEMETGYFERNNQLKREFPDRFFDLIGEVIDEDQRVPIFTPECKFISQDCRHFTIAGAKYFARLFDDRIGHVLEKAKRSATGSSVSDAHPH